MVYTGTLFITQAQGSEVVAFQLLGQVVEDVITLFIKALSQQFFSTATTHGTAMLFHQVSGANLD